MPRPLRVRAATDADLPALLAFGDELREQLLPTGDGARRVATGAARVALEVRYLEALADPGRHLVVVEDPRTDDGPLGMAVLTVAPVNALVDVPAVHMSHAVVADRHRRRGAGKALVGAAVGYADERGIEQLVVSVHPGSRDANRFFARLGLTPVAVRRSAPVATVRRRLVTGEGFEPAGRRPRRTVRSPRRPGLPLGPATGEPGPP